MLAENRIRHTIVSVLLVHSLLGIPTITHALSCAPRQFTLSEAYGAADSIIVGLITECKEEISRDSWANGGDDCSFTSLEVLKESVPARDYSGATSSSGCGLSLHVGGQYLLFLDSSNRPLRFSAPLSGDHYQTELAGRYLKIIRDYRDKRVNDLAEPWTFSDHMGQCSVSQSVRGNHISFSVRGSGAPEFPEPSWVIDSIDGHTVYRATVPIYDPDTKMPSGEAELIAYGEVPDYGDKMVFGVTMLERQPPVIRQASISVGSTTWPLLRMDTIVSVSDVSTHTMVRYLATGQTAEQILSAMGSSQVERESEVAPPNQSSFELVTPGDNYFGESAPEQSATTQSQNSKARATRAYQPKQDPPEPVLRIESRSTQLATALRPFEACHAGGR
jgi:hypothetical protein